MGNRIQRRFDYLRDQAEQGANSQAQQANEGLTRQAAAQGRLGSGSFQKQQLAQQKQASGLKQNAINDVESQREAALAGQEESQAQRDFAKSEREAGQGFAAEQAGINRAFSTSERMGSESFASAQSAAQRGFDAGLFDKNMAFQEKTLKNQSAQFKAQMAMALKQFGLDETVSKFNMDMASKQFNKPEMMDVFWKFIGSDPKTGKNNVPGFGGQLEINLELQDFSKR